MTRSPDPLLGAQARARAGRAGTGLLDRPDGPGGGGGDDAGSPGGGGGRRSTRAVLWLVMVAVIAMGLIVATVLPVRSYVQQRRDIAAAEEALEELEADNRALAARVAELGTDEALEQAARESLNLVRPGEESYALLPPQFPTELPPMFPYALARRLLEPGR